VSVFAGALWLIGHGVSTRSHPPIKKDTSTMISRACLIVLIGGRDFIIVVELTMDIYPYIYMCICICIYICIIYINS
jgi:hypothetical protein